MAIYKIKIAKVTEIKAHNGSSFHAYKTVDKTGRFMDLKFQKNCRNVPDSPCWIYVTDENFNVDSNRQYPVMWVKDVERIEPFAPVSSNVSDYFDPEPEAAPQKKPDTAFTPF